MRKECRTLCGMFIVLIVFCVTLPVVSQQPNKDSAVIQYTGTVDMSELVKKADDLGRNIDTLTKNQDQLIQDVKEVREQVIRIDERTKNIMAIVIGGVITIIGGLIVAVVVQNFLFKRQIKGYIPELLLQSQKLESGGQEKPEDSSGSSFNFNDNTEGKLSNA